MIEFNSANLINKDDAEDEDNYEFKGILPDEDDEEDIDILSAEIDGAEVIITLVDAVDNQSEGTLTIADAILGEDYEETIEFFDQEIPEVLSAEVVGCDTIKVYFSEPINFGDLDEDGFVEDSDIEEAFELDDGDFFVRSVKPNESGTEANVRFYTDFEEGTYTFAVLNDIEDYAGFSVIGEEFEVEVVIDEESPELIDYKDAKAREITLVFNEDIQPADGATELDVEAFYHTNTKNPAKTAEIINGNEIKLTFEEDYELPNGSAYVYVDEEAIEDLWENINATSLWIKAEIDYDEEAPEVDEIEMDDQYTIKVTFDEDVEDDSAEDEDNYKVLDEDDDEVDIDDVNRDEDDYNIVYIELDDEIYGDCTLVIDGVEDLYGNAMDKTEIAFSADDETDPDFEDFSATLYDTDDDVYTVVVDFDGNKMAVDGKYSVVDLEKYKIDGVYLDDIDEDYIDIRAVDNNKKVEIEIEKDNDKDLEIIADETTLIMARVADAAGNYTEELVSDPITIEDGINAPLAVDKIEAIDNDEIKVTLKGKAVDFKANDFIVETEDGDKIQIEGAKINNSGDNSVINITLDKELNDDATYGGVREAVYVSTVPPVDTENEYGQKLKIDEVIVKDKITPSLNEIEVDDEDVDDVVVDVDARIVALTFTEDIDPATISVVSFEVEDMSVAKAWAEDNVVYLELKEDADELEAGLEVTQIATIKDANGNKVSDIDTEIAKEVDLGLGDSDKVAPEFDYDGATEIAIKNGDDFIVPEVTATDNEDDEVEVTYVIKDADGNKVKAEDIDTTVPGTYTIIYSAEDLAGNKAEDLVITVTVLEKGEFTASISRNYNPLLDFVELEVSDISMVESISEPAGAKITEVDETTIRVYSLGGRPDSIVLNLINGTTFTVPVE